MMTMVDWSLAMAGVPLLAAAAYLLTLTLLWRRQAPGAPRNGRLRFCIVVPAHNEARGIGDTIGSLQALDYPADLRRIVVVADNCTDGTAEVAAAHGADVIVRTDPDRRGKGWALQYAIDRLLASTATCADWDALVVIDADSVASPNLLQVLASHFASGGRAVQAAYLPRRAGNSATAVLTDVALTAFHLVRSVGRERLGLSCGLRGNGMAFRRDLLREIPHTAYSRTEDLEFGVLLGLRGVRVVFAGDARVYGDMPEPAAVVARQRERWIAGRAAIARRFVPTLLRETVRSRSLMAADLACDLIMPPLSLLVLASALGLAASLALTFWVGGPTWSASIWSLACVGLGIHVTHAARVAGRGRALVAAAGAIPRYALGRALTALRALRPSEDVWIRTTRNGERP